MTEHPSHPDSLLSRQRLRQVLILVLLLVGLAGCVWILSPYLHAIILAALLGYVFAPVHAYLLKLTRDRHNLAALLSCLAVALVVLLPIVGFSTTLISRGMDTYESVKVWLEEGNLSNAMKSDRVKQIMASGPVTRALALRKQYFPAWTIDKAKDYVLDKAGKLVPKVKDGLLAGLGNVVAVFGNFVLMLFCMFYFFRDGSKIMAYLIRLSPLPPAHEQLLIDRVQVVTKSALSGTILTGAAQGVLAMIAFAIVGIPWLFWGVMLGIASLIPIVGTALIWVPCTIYLLIKTDPSVGGAIFLATWCIVVVGLADNFLRPWLMQGNTGMSSLILFFAILGGIQTFGIIGVIYGPLIFGLCAVMLYIFELETGEKPVPAGGEPPADAPPKRRKRRRRRRPRSDYNGSGGDEFNDNDSSPEDDNT